MFCFSVAPTFKLIASKRSRVKDVKISTGSGLLAVSIVVLVAYIFFGIIIGFWANDNKIDESSVKQTVHLDYMYAQWCEYCPQTNKNVVEVTDELSANVKLKIWDESKRTSDENTRQIYEDYKSKQLFGGFPTLVADHKQMLVGARSKQQIKEWICNQFEEQNMPQECTKQE